MPKSYRLPDRTSTSDVEVFTREWENIYKPLEEALGVRCIAFDPGIRLARGNESVAIPLWLAHEINSALNKKPEI